MLARELTIASALTMPPRGSLEKCLAVVVGEEVGKFDSARAVSNRKELTLKVYLY